MVCVGTCGYDYLDWRENFYPPQLKRADFLAWYAARFGLLELNFTYYQMPEARQLEDMAQRSGKDLVFSVKAHSSLTHGREEDTWGASAGVFLDALKPLVSSGHLGAVLFQFPFSFHYTPENRKYLDGLLHRFEGLPAVVEFRNAEWINNRVIEALRGRKVSFGLTDLPALPGLPPDLDCVTAPLAYLRFHGRNSEAWWGSDSAGRYDYLYSAEELEPWAIRISALSALAEKVFVLFNNHRNGQAPANARMLLDLLQPQDAAGVKPASP